MRSQHNNDNMMQYKPSTFSSSDGKCGTKRTAQVNSGFSPIGSCFIIKTNQKHIGKYFHICIREMTWAAVKMLNNALHHFFNRLDFPRNDIKEYSEDNYESIFDLFPVAHTSL